jgi:hypothetical protein
MAAMGAEVEGLDTANAAAVRVMVRKMWPARQIGRRRSQITFHNNARYPPSGNQVS